MTCRCGHIDSKRMDKYWSSGVKNPQKSRYVIFLHPHGIVWRDAHIQAYKKRFMPTQKWLLISLHAEHQAYKSSPNRATNAYQSLSGGELGITPPALLLHRCLKSKFPVPESRDSDDEILDAQAARDHDQNPAVEAARRTESNRLRAFCVQGTSTIILQTILRSWLG